MLMLRLLAALLALSVAAGCAAAPRDNAENVCMFMFLAEMPNPFGVVVGAAMCTFGVEMLPSPPDDEECDEDEDDCEDEEVGVRV